MMQKLFEWRDERSAYSVTLFNDLTCLIATLDGIWVCNAYTLCNAALDEDCIASIARVNAQYIVKEQMCIALQGNKIALFNYVLNSVISYLSLMDVIDDHLIKRILATRYSRKIGEAQWGIL